MLLLLPLIILAFIVVTMRFSRDRITWTLIEGERLSSDVSRWESLQLKYDQDQVFLRGHTSCSGMQTLPSRFTQQSRAYPSLTVYLSSSQCNCAMTS